MIGNGSFGVVYQARLIDSQEMVAIKKVLQDKRFKVMRRFLSAAPGSGVVVAVEISKRVCARFPCRV